MLRTVAIMLAFTAMCLAGCHSGSIGVRGRGERVVADDGFELMAYRFTQAHEPAGEPRATVMYVQGSEDRSVTGSMGALAGFCAMNAPVIAVERRGVTPDGKVDRAAALRYATKERRVADVLRALDWGLAGVPAGKPVVLLGASEGGDVACGVAARSKRVTHVILLGTGGGWTQEREFRELIRSNGACVGLKSEGELDARVADIRAHPDAETLWAGHPYRRWSTFMFDRPADDLLKFDGPILVVHGMEDESVPIGSARALRDEFAKAGKSNLKLVEIPGVDHGFRDAKTGEVTLPLVEVAVVGWLGEQGVLERDEVGMYLERVREAHRGLFPEKSGADGR